EGAAVAGGEAQAAAPERAPRPQPAVAEAAAVPAGEGEGERAPRKRRRRRRGKPVDGNVPAGDQSNPSALPAIRQSAPSLRGQASAQAPAPAKDTKRESLLGRIGRKLRSLVGG